MPCLRSSHRGSAPQQTTPSAVVEHRWIQEHPQKYPRATPRKQKKKATNDPHANYHPSIPPERCLTIQFGEASSPLSSSPSDSLAPCDNLSPASVDGANTVISPSINPQVAEDRIAGATASNHEGLTGLNFNGLNHSSTQVMPSYCASRYYEPLFPSTFNPQLTGVPMAQGTDSYQEDLVGASSIDITDSPTAQHHHDDYYHNLQPFHGHDLLSALADGMRSEGDEMLQIGGPSSSSPVDFPDNEHLYWNGLADLW